MSYALYVDLDEILFAVLTADNDVVTQLGDEPARLYLSVVPVGLAILPYAVFNTIKTREIYRTPTAELEAVYRVTIYADNRVQAHAIQGAIHEAIMTSSFPITDYGCYAVNWLGASVATSEEAGRIVWSVTGEYRVCWAKT
ncbi:MAG TPA: hypothetical protein PLZ51_29245 [Aggregatilineales bacterium]|nr:hypothetical protein [Aggregatilineales bacterium]